VNAASGWVSQIARSSAVIVNQPNVYMYRPGSITRPTCAQVTLFMGKSLSLCLQSPISTSLEFFGTPRRSLPEAFFGFFLKLATLRSGLLSSWASSFFIIASRDFLLGHRDDQYKREDQHRPLVGFIGGHCPLSCGSIQRAIARASQHRNVHRPSDLGPTGSGAPPTEIPDVGLGTGFRFSVWTVAGADRGIAGWVGRADCVSASIFALKAAV
jgi:hypothetical protein